MVTIPKLHQEIRIKKEQMQIPDLQMEIVFSMGVLPLYLSPLCISDPKII